jgi:NADH-quinone oxidoreductase subunit M
MSTLLLLILLAPLAGAALTALLPRSAARWVQLLAAGASLAAGLLFFAGYTGEAAQADASAQGYFGYLSLPWIAAEGIDIRFSIGVDGISVFLVLLTPLLFTVLSLYDFSRRPAQEKLYYLMLLLLQTGLTGYFISLDLLLFYVFFELVLIPGSFLIGLWGGERRQEAAMRFFLYTLAGSLLMLIAILYLAMYTLPEVFTTDYVAIAAAVSDPARGGFPLEVQHWLFAAFAFSFAIKSPLFPFHSWQPLAYAESSTSGSILMAALMSKMGVYGFIRFGVALFPDAAQLLAPWIAALAVVSILYGAWMAAVQTDLKRLIAFSSLSHIGFIILGVFAFNKEALSGAVLQMTAHGLATAALFFLADMLYARHGSYDIRSYQGMARLAPKYTALFMVAVLASVGLPGLSGFVGEFMILLGAYGSPVLHRALSVLATAGVVLAAVYLLDMFRRMMFGGSRPELAARSTDLNGREAAVLLPLTVLMFWIGLNATPFLSYINDDTGRMLIQIDPSFDPSQMPANLEDLPEEPEPAAQSPETAPQQP